MTTRPGSVSLVLVSGDTRLRLGGVLTGRSTTETTMYVVMQGSETHYWYSLLTSEGTLSTNDNQLLEMRVFPNPVDANYISILSPISGDKEIEIYTLTGRKVLQTTILNSTLNIESLTAGFYMIKVTIDNKSKTSKLVVR